MQRLSNYLQHVLKENHHLLKQKNNILFEKVFLEDKISSWFVVDIESNYKKSTLKQFYYNEIYFPSFDKKTTIDASERSIFHLLELSKEINDKSESFKCTKKTHATLFRKVFVLIPRKFKIFDSKR